MVTPASGPAQTTYYSVINRVDSVKIATSPATVTRYAYDSLYLTSVTDPKNQVYQTVYNALGWVIKNVDPVGGRDSMQYSTDGEIRRTVTRRGLTVDLGYDALHRPITQTGGSSVSWSYTGNGLIVADSSAVSRETVYANLRGQPDSIRTILNGQTYWRRYRYGTAGFLDSLVATGPAGTTFTPRRFVYDTLKGVLKRIDLGTQTTAFTRDGNLNLTAIALPGGDTVKFTLGSLQAPVKITASPASYNNSTEQWLGFDAHGRLDKLHRYPNAKTGRWFQYDSLGRLTVSSNVQRTPENLPGGCPSMDFGMSGACAPAGDYAIMSADTVTYDPVGNRTDKGGTYTTGNRITAFGGCSYATDAEGNVVRRTGTSPCVPIDTLIWTAEGQLDSLQVGSTGVKYLYDARGRLVMRRVNGTAQSTFLWDGDNLLAELNGTATALVAEYSYYGLDRLHALIVNGVRYYAHADGRGSVIALTDSAQSAVRTYGYDDWGTLTGGSDGLPFSGKDRARWKGAVWMGPEADAYYMRNRWYEAGTGRFLSEDPIGLNGGINPTVFAGANPIQGRDPLGLYQSLDDCDWIDTNSPDRQVLECPFAWPWDFGRGPGDFNFDWLPLSERPFFGFIIDRAEHTREPITWWTFFAAKSKGFRSCPDFVQNYSMKLKISLDWAATEFHERVELQSFKKIAWYWPKSFFEPSGAEAYEGIISWRGKKFPASGAVYCDSGGFRFTSVTSL